MKIVKTVSKSENEEIQEQLSVFSPRTYDILKWCVTIVLPAVATLYLTLASTWDLPAKDEVVATITAVSAFLGVLIGISAKRYKESDAPHQGDMIVTVDGGGVSAYQLALNGDPESLAEMDSVSFKVKKQPVYNPAP